MYEKVENMFWEDFILFPFCFSPSSFWLQERIPQVIHT